MTPRDFQVTDEVSLGTEELLKQTAGPNQGMKKERENEREG